MLDRLKRFLTAGADSTGFRPAAGNPGATGKDSAEHRLQLAACALLLEVAHADDTFTSEEQLHIEEALARHFALDPAETRELMALADERRREAIDLHQFTSLINEQYDEGQRFVLAEILWRVVHADGQLSGHEDALMQKLARLLDLRPGFLAAARKRAISEP
ncbi:MAG: TerB family tellurite resistance protein [Candidatus Eiseniibacteriota bacterium]